MLKKIITAILKKILAVKAKDDFILQNPQKFLIIRQHNQFGDMLATIPILRAIKEKYPNAEINVIASKFNDYALSKSKYVNKILTLENVKLINRKYRKEVKNILKQNYDVAIVPSTVSISFTSNFLARLSDAELRVGPASLNGKTNPTEFFFNKKIDLDWRKDPDAHVSDFGQNIIRPLGISTWNVSSEINFDEEDTKVAETFIAGMGKSEEELLIGLHVGAGKPRNRWPLEKYIETIKTLDRKYNTKFVLTGSNADKNEIDYVVNNLNVPISQFINYSIPELAALISNCDLFITNDTGVMHVAGATKTKQISIFGPTNPFNWAPVGEGKYFLRKSDIIDDVKVSDVVDLAILLLGKN